MPFVCKSRFLALLMALCYGWLGIVGSCLHTHLAVGEPPATPSQSVASISLSSAKTTHTVKAAPAQADHCFTCEWQQANLSPALPPVLLILPYLPQTDIDTASPRAPSVVTIRVSSRAPPTV